MFAASISGDQVIKDLTMKDNAAIYSEIDFPQNFISEGHSMLWSGVEQAGIPDREALQSLTYEKVTETTQVKKMPRNYSDDSKELMSHEDHKET